MTLYLDDDVLEVDFHYDRPCGETTCTLTLNRDLVFEGYAMCSPHDTFSKRVGRKVALARALDGMGLARSARREIWRAVWDTGMSR